MIKQKNENISKSATESVNNAREFLQTSLQGIEKVAKLQLDSSKKILDETSDAIKQIASSKNPEEFFNHLNQLATHSVETNISNCRDLYKILSDVQTNIAKLIENNIHHTQSNMARAAQGFTSYNPSSASEAFQSWVNNSNQAISTMKKVAAQVTEFTNKNIKTATSNMSQKTTPKK